MNQTPSNTEQNVLHILGGVINRAPSSITLQDTIDSLCRDSIQMFEVILAFEKAYNTNVQYEDLINIETVADIIQYIESKNIPTIDSLQPETFQQFLLTV